MKINTNIHISDNIGYRFKHLNKLFVAQNESVILIIDYPLHDPFIKKLNGGKLGLTAADLVDEIIKSYQKIYQNLGKYGVWGHDMEDLVIEGINRTGNKIYLSIGS